MRRSCPLEEACVHCRRMNPADGMRSLTWPHGRVEVQRLGAMLGPLRFEAPGHQPFEPLQVAPWADEPGAAALPGILRRLRGEWPCVPFGRTDRPHDLPAAWSRREPDDDAGHGHGSNHEWHWLPSDDALQLRLAIDYPATSAVRRLERRIRARADAPALDIELHIEMRRPQRLPVALHPVLRLDAGRVELHVEHDRGGVTYPVPCEPGISRLAPDHRFEALHSVPLAATAPAAVDGRSVDASRLPLPFDGEELLMLRGLQAPLEARFIDHGWTFVLDWDRALLPDLMLWISQRGRQGWPWNGRHLGLGVEPVNGPFDLGRVAEPPPGHAAASHLGVALDPARPCVLRYSLRARADR